jgi:serine/threonine protein kinase
MPEGALPAEPDGPPRAARDSAALAEALAARGLRLEERLHSGHFTDVWRAASARGGFVAIKAPAPAWSGHAGVHAWLRREHRVLMQLDHPRIVRALDFIEPGFIGPGRCCALVTEYLGGGDLVPLAGTDPRQWADAAAGIATALRHVHEHGYVHGDVKARNVLFSQGSPQSAPKLADFGSAMPIGAELPAEFGTKAHRPPRRASRRAAPGDDVYAFAVLLYELLAGHLPYAPGSRARHGEASGAKLKSPYTGSSPALRSLALRVVGVLEAPDSGEARTLTDFFDVIQWAHKGS